MDKSDHADLGGTFFLIPAVPEILCVQYTTLVGILDVANVPTLLVWYICMYKVSCTYMTEKNVTPAIINKWQVCTCNI